MAGSILDTIPPDQLAKFLRLGTLNEQQPILQDEINKAMQMSQPQGVQHTTPMGALFGGLGDAAREVGGAAKMHQLRGQQMGNLKEAQDTRGDFAKAMIQALRGPTTPDGAVDSHALWMSGSGYGQ